ncbi:IbrB-like domain-containing protein [Sphingobacterium chuzhouense]|uniref:ParB-like nuclease domain-containing protein n=1 Tax=Sphingobacterium chuzhouense TaxID=1742264 RepID=A0ABR7XL85_9SPHI|nr:ParB/RepB/Spo0J family partition protein [Sphingobacterium chuzhouense]MBD1419950.1 ParB-like nuclease domain-containing protein [Sphingobacterium chuzhouense]
MISQLLEKHKTAPFEKKVELYNQISQQLYEFIGIEHPSLNVQLVPIDRVEGNDYNPNKVAPPEMKLLALSIKKDGLTMPVVVASEKKGNNWVVVDGFHRTAVCKEVQEIRDDLKGYLPVTRLDKTLENRVASTVRHNMARGTHQVELSAKLVAFLKRNDWTNKRIGDELGMDPDEVLRLKQITGLAEAFQDKEFSKSWGI